MREEEDSYNCNYNRGNYNDWSSDDETNYCNIPTPGCQPSPSESSQRHSLQPTQRRQPSASLAGWDLQYELEWKLTLNKREVAKQTEQDLVLAPSDFWKETLCPRIDKLVQKTRLTKPCEADETTIVMSVTKRSVRNVTKQFEDIDNQWHEVERQLQTWSQLFRDGEKLRIHATFKYVESKAAGPAGQGSTAGQLAERNDRRVAETAVLGRPAAWELVFTTFACPGPPCDRGPYCWQDPDGKKHYKLLGHQLRQLVMKVQQGQEIKTHDDMPEDIRKELHAEMQQHSARKRKRGSSEADAAGFPGVIHIHNSMPGLYDAASAHPRQRSTPEAISSCLPPRLQDILGLRDDVVDEYCAWHCLQVRRQTHKEYYELARDLLLDEGLSLVLIYEDQEGVFQFLVDRGVLKGIARHFVRDIVEFLEKRHAS